MAASGERSGRATKAAPPPPISRDSAPGTSFIEMLDVHVTPGPRSERSGVSEGNNSSAFTFPLTERGRQSNWQGLWPEFKTLCCNLIRPFIMVHEIKGTEREMRRHPSLHGRAADGRVTRFFLWRKWTLIVILFQMIAQYAIDLNNFRIFMVDPYEAQCPVRKEVTAMKQVDKARRMGAAQSAALGAILTNSTGILANSTTKARAARGNNATQALRGNETALPLAPTANLTSPANASVTVDAAGNVVRQPDTEQPPQAAAPPTQTGQRPGAGADLVVPPVPPGAKPSLVAPPGVPQKRVLAEGGPTAGANATAAANSTADVAGNFFTGNRTGNATGGAAVCMVCNDLSALTGASPFCYRYYATPGWNPLIRSRIGNEARVGSVGLRVLNGTKPVRLQYMCNNMMVGEMETQCFEDKRLLIRRNCSMGFWTDEHVEAHVYALLGRVMYAPDAAMHWGDCDAIAHVQKRNPVCLLESHTVNRTVCETGNVAPPMLEKPCCTSSEDMYDTVFNPDYYNIQIFFDVVWLVCSLVRLVAAVLALRWIDNYRWSSGAIRLTWCIPFISAFIKYSWPLVSFVSPTGREMASEFMTTVTSVDYINSTTLTQLMGDAGFGTKGGDVITLYVINLINSIRSNIAYNQAWALVCVEFTYRFMYATYVFGEIGPLATAVLPAFRSSSVMLKTLLPESSMLGWFVSFGPMLYVPFIIGGLSAGVQVFSDYWFTIGSVLYSISMLIQVIFFMRNSGSFNHGAAFRNQHNRQEYLRGFFVIASIGFFLAFAIQSSTNQGDTDAKGTLASIGFVGCLSFCLRFVFNFQLSVMFVADATIYVLRRIQKESERDNSGSDYERALAEFDALDVIGHADTSDAKVHKSSWLNWLFIGRIKADEENDKEVSESARFEGRGSGVIRETVSALAPHQTGPSREATVARPT